MKQDLHTLPENTTFLSSIYRKMCLHYVTMYPRFVFPESVLHSNEVKLAERSKAPDLSSGTRKCAWVRTPHLTNTSFFFFRLYSSSQRTLCLLSFMIIREIFDIFGTKIQIQHLIQVFPVRSCSAFTMHHFSWKKRSVTVFPLWYSIFILQCFNLAFFVLFCLFNFHEIYSS